MSTATPTGELSARLATDAPEQQIRIAIPLHAKGQPQSPSSLSTDKSSSKRPAIISNDMQAATVTEIIANEGLSAQISTMTKDIFDELQFGETSSKVSKIATSKADQDALIAKCPSSLEDLFADMDADYIVIIGPFDYAALSAEMVQRQTATSIIPQDAICFVAVNNTLSDLVGGLLTAVFNVLSPVLVK